MTLCVNKQTSLQALLHCDGLLSFKPKRLITENRIDNESKHWLRACECQHVSAYFVFYLTLSCKVWPGKPRNTSALQNATAVPGDLMFSEPPGELTLTFTTCFGAAHLYRIAYYHIFVSSFWKGKKIFEGTLKVFRTFLLTLKKSFYQPDNKSSLGTF